MSLRLLAIAAAFVFTHTAYAADPIVIKYSHVVAGQSPTGQAALELKELAEK